MTKSQSAITAAIKLLELEGYQVTRPASPTAWDYTLLRKYSEQQTAAKGYTAKCVPSLRDL